MQTSIICQRLHDVTVNQSLEFSKARARLGELAESSVPVEVHSELQKRLDDSQSRVMELEVDLVTEESKVSDLEDSMKRLREESEKESQQAKESETKLRSELGKLQSELEKCRAQLKAEAKARASAEAQVKVEAQARASAEAQVEVEAQARALAEAKAKAADEELEGIGMDAIYLAWINNRSMDLAFLEDPSALARFETRLSAEESAAAQARQAISEGRTPEANPIVVIEADVPPAASNPPAP